MGLVEKVKAHPELIFHTSGTEMVRIWEYEDRLGFEFPETYEHYLNKLGAIGIRDIEWTGLDIDPDLNVYRLTLKAREEDPEFPKDCFILRTEGEDGNTVICDANEKVYSWKDGDRAKLADSLEEYLDRCIALAEGGN